jgi:hypothetical protein
VRERAVPQDSGAASGSYWVHAIYYEEVQHLVISVSNDDWIDRPAGYNVVGLDGTISPDGTLFSGRRFRLGLLCVYGLSELWRRCVVGVLTAEVLKEAKELTAARTK